MFTEEFFELYKKYEKAVHSKDRDKGSLENFLCNSPIYDPDKDIDMITHPSLYEKNSIDEKREFKDEGVYPESRGTYFMYHRIDGKLIAVGVIDILTTIFNSGYFIYDPEYSFLSMGVVGAIREFEYMRLIKQKFNPYLKWY